MVCLDETEKYTNAFDQDDPTLAGRYPIYQTDTYLGDRRPTPIELRQALVSE